MDESVTYYIQKGRRDGYKDEEIKSALVKAGWNEEFINLQLGKLPGGSADTPEKKTASLRSWLKQFYFQHAQQIAAICATTLFGVMFRLAEPYPIKLVIDSVFSNVEAFWKLDDYRQTPRLLTIAAILMLIIFAFRQTFEYVSERLSHTYSYSVDARVKKNFFQHILRLPVNYKKKLQSGEYIYRQNAEKSEVARLVIDVPVAIFGAAIYIIVAFIVMFILSPSLALVTIMVVPAMYGTMLLFEPSIEKSEEKLAKKQKQIYRYSEESVDNMEAIQSFTNEARQTEGLIKMLSERLSNQIENLHFVRGYDFLRGLIVAVGSFVIIFIGGRYVQNVGNEFTIGNMIIFLSYVTGFYGPMQILTRGVRDLRSSKKDIQLFFDVLTDHTEVDAQDKQGLELPSFSRGISMQQVSISDENKEILKNINIDIAKGQKVGLVGPSGGGKTALLRSLLRFNDYSSGSISIDGLELTELNFKSLRDQITMIDGEPQLFSDTILNNIMFAASDTNSATSEDVVNAVTNAKALKFIESLPDNYETNIGDALEFITPLHYHKIALARAFVAKSPILLIDEPTADLDIASEKEVHEILYNLMTDKTVVLVSNRLSILTQMDEVYVVDGGVVLNVNDYGGLDRYQSYLSTHELI